MKSVTEIRVLVVEDSPTVRRYLVELIEELPGMTVIGEARDGEEAVRLVQSLRPDVISMDLQMPHMDGLHATRQIMAECSTPIVVVSQLLERDVALSMEALGAGALAVVSKPPHRSHPDFPDALRALHTNLRAMAGVKVVSRRPPRHEPGKPPLQKINRSPQMIAIAASTGGPRALRDVLAAFPENFPLPIVIVQHMPPEFIPGLVRWLDNHTALRVYLAEDGMILQPGMVLIAPGDTQLRMLQWHKSLSVRLIPPAKEERYCPSADVLFQSVGEACKGQAIGVILTGMGNDGAAGLLALREAGGCTIAQDEISSTVYGMPRAAVAAGAVQHITNLAEIPSKIWDLL